MVRRRAALTAAVAGALAAGLLAACGGVRSGSGGPNSITLYSGQHPETTRALVMAFERRTGIHVNERDGDETALVQEIEQEGDSTPADVIYSENSPALMALQGKGLLAPLPAGTLASVPAGDSSPAGNWVGVSARVGVFVYNTASLRPAQLPSSILDLASPRWKGKLALAPTETDFEPIVVSVQRAVGTKAAVAWLKALHANASSHIEPDNETVTADVNSGQAVIGLVDHYYWYRLAKESGPSATHSRIGYFAAGDPGFVVDVSGVGVLRSSRHRAQAEQLAAFLVSAAGQQIIGANATDSYEYPLRPGVAAAAGLPPLDGLHPAAVTISELGDGSTALDLLQRAQLL